MNNSQRLWAALTDNHVDTVAYLPCNKLNTMMLNKPDGMAVWDITREAAGVGLCFGRSLGGKRSAMLIQNTGLGNLVTELYTMPKLYQTALPIFVSWRGHYQEPIEAQIIFGEKVEAMLAALDIEFRILACNDDLQDIQQDVAACFEQNKIKVYLLSPEIWEQSVADYHAMGSPQIDSVEVDTPAYKGSPGLNRFGAIQHIMNAVKAGDVVLPQIGFPAKEVYNTADRPSNFYMLGALGSATAVGIGLASVIEDKHVYVIDGDGSFFFNPNQFIDLASHPLDNLTVICLDNGSWGSTGNQPTLSSQGYNLTAMAKSVGIYAQIMTDDPATLSEAIQSRAHRFIHYMIKPGNDKTGVEIPLSALEIKTRFMQAIGV